MTETTIYITVLILFILITVISMPKVKGWFGEKTVGTILSRLPKEHYRLINNVMLKTERGTTQIDHIVVSLYGIFVIETKNYKGWITGSEYSEQWTKNVYGKKYKFLNPIKQNYGHIKALQKRLELSEDKFISIIAFSTHADLKVKTDTPVIYTINLCRKIKSYSEDKFDISELEDIVNRINSANIDSSDMRKEHVKEIKKNIHKEKVSVKNGNCPRCGGKLIKRKGKYGNFLGCTNYPKCRFTTK